MYSIHKITSHHVVDFAAEELKKYLRMMMPACGEIDIHFAPEATGGFRLGLMSDFGLDTSDAEDTELDDILFIDTDGEGGILAGSNPRSILLAVYRYLTLNGCRWLFPGIDGERIPVKEIEPVHYRKLADCRFRGQCNEGAEYQPNMMEAIDFTPKIGMNIFMIEFDTPNCYYDVYYHHTNNTANREEEPVTHETILQWKRQCEAELSKRGLQFHDMGHGWTAMAFDVDAGGGWYSVDESAIPEESRQFVAMMEGERKLRGGVAINTNFCMSSPEARKKVADRVADYAALATNVDYLHVWLADGSANHCECEVCRQKIPSDWYVMLMNDIDEALTARSLPTHIVFICYVDTTWAPETVELRNPARFSLLVAAITRDYTEPVDPEATRKPIALKPYELNRSPLPKSVNEYLAHAKLWVERCPVPFFVYEYHFWLAQYRDVGIIDAARIIYDDVRGYRANGGQGIVEDGSQRSFFPNGFAFYVYAETLYDSSRSFESMVEDYFSHAYGEDWREVVAFLKKVGQTVPFAYANGKCSEDAARGAFFAPSLAASWRALPALVEDFRPFLQAHKTRGMRAESVAYKLLRYYAEYLCGISEPMALLCEGKNVAADDAYRSFANDFGRYELDIERWYDHYMCVSAVGRIFSEQRRLEPF